MLQLWLNCQKVQIITFASIAWVCPIRFGSYVTKDIFPEILDANASNMSIYRVFYLHIWFPVTRYTFQQFLMTTTIFDIVIGNNAVEKVL